MTMNVPLAGGTLGASRITKDSTYVTVVVVAVVAVVVTTVVVVVVGISMW